MLVAFLSGHAAVGDADDHTVVRQGLRKVLEERPEWQVVAEAGDGRDAVRLAEQHKPDVAVVDVAMPLLNGIEATRQITRRAPQTKVLVLSMYSDEAYVTQMLKAGATGYLLKDSADVDLLQAVQAVSQGKSFFSPAVARLMSDDYARQRGENAVDRYESLSEFVYDLRHPNASLLRPTPLVERNPVLFWKGVSLALGLALLLALLARFGA